jgi:ribosome modulation factor
MKRQKRDLEQRAYNRGYNAGVSGKSKSLCPNTSLEANHQWLAGWRDGREDNWSGLKGVSGIHKMPGIST